MLGRGGEVSNLVVSLLMAGWLPQSHNTLHSPLTSHTITREAGSRDSMHTPLGCLYSISGCVLYTDVKWLRSLKLLRARTWNWYRTPRARSTSVCLGSWHLGGFMKHSGVIIASVVVDNVFDDFIIVDIASRPWDRGGIHHTQNFV